MPNNDKQYIEWLQGSMFKRLRRDFDVRADAITCQGEVEHAVHRVTICGFCRERRMHAPIYFEPPEGEESVSYLVEFSVDLVPHYRMLDNTYRPRVWLILAGQCKDCGHLYYIYTLQKEGNPYIEQRRPGGT